MPTTVQLDQAHTIIGEPLGPTRPFTVDQDMIDRFADVTGDHQWIHVDRERARQGPFGTTIAHGFLALSLFPRVLEELLVIEGVSAGFNYGLDRCRFPAVVASGSQVTGTLTVAEVLDVAPGVRRIISDITLTVVDAPKPAVVARQISQFTS